LTAAFESASAIARPMPEELPHTIAVLPVSLLEVRVRSRGRCLQIRAVYANLRRVELAHLGLCSVDTRSLAEWYVDLLDFERASDNGKDPPTIFVRSADGTLIEIYPADVVSAPVDNKVQGLRHIGLRPASIDAARARLVVSGVEIVDDLRTHPNGAQTLFFRDPEGNLLHLLRVPE
jgi:glyoxylase I family protein